ncbi:BID domain-containing T4SS effector [Bartonella phoceensis]|uniref:BID domain-containing T4SS effector n=1 Tax=Bartonella phoceensis TaxID=270249 RepID=UPI001ABB7087|nr:BID domain-containing T4SS effector [Bartonella phoceensis]
MKKNNPSRPPFNPEELYARVNKQGRTQHPNQPEEVVYADLNLPGSSGNRESEEVVYADLNLPESSSSPRTPKPEEPIYATVRPRGPGGGNNREEPTYATVRPRGPGGGYGSEQASPYADSPKREGPLTRGAVTRGLQRNDLIQSGQEEIRKLCEVVYGNRNALDGTLEKLLINPSQAEQLSWSLAENPEGPGPLSGRKVLGVKNQERKNAEDGFVKLCAAFDRHAENVQAVKQELFRPEPQEHKALQRRGAVRHHKTQEQTAGDQEQTRKSPSKGMGMAL